MGQYSFKLPDIGEGTAEAEIAGWRVNVGDRVEEDQPLVDMMTDKATVELASPVTGIVQSIAGQAGQMAAVGSVLVILETESDEALTAPAAKPQSAPTPSSPARAQPSTSPSATDAREKAAPAASVIPRKAGGVARTRPARAAASPAVRRRAEELGVKLQFVQGSGRPEESARPIWMRISQTSLPRPERLMRDMRSAQESKKFR